MSEKQKIFLAIVFLLSIFFVVGYHFDFKKPNEVGVLDYKYSMVINNKQINIDIATTTEKKMRGLSGQDNILSNQGLLFVFENSDKYGFWMKEMKFPIDIIWIDEKNKVVTINKSVLPDSFPKVYYPNKKVKYVLETEAGFADINNIKVGDFVILPNFLSN